MIMTKYQADLPYPAINGLKENREQAMILMKAYSGQYSELTTSAQYAYHKLKCIRKPELYETLQGIFLVETHHLELLGNCINQLGIDPRYYMNINDKMICWQPEVINYGNNIRNMISFDIEGEQQSAAFYVKTAETIGNEKIAALLFRIAEDENLHFRLLNKLYNKYFVR